MTAHSRSVEVSSCTRGSSAGITISFCLKRTDTGSLHSRGIVCDFPDDIMILRTQTWGWGWGWLVLKPSKTCPFRGALASFITSRIWEERPSLTHHSSQNELCLQWNGYGVQPLLSFFCFVLLCFLVFLVVLFFFFWLHPIARGTSAPGPGTEPVSPALEDGVLPSGALGKSHVLKLSITLLFSPFPQSHSIPSSPKTARIQRNSWILIFYFLIITLQPPSPWGKRNTVKEERMGK